MAENSVTASLKSIFEALLGHFGTRNWWPAETPFEVVAGAILTQNTAWRNVERAIAALKAEGPLTAESLLRLEPQRLETLIRPVGFFRQKAHRLQLFSAYLMSQYDGELSAMLSGPLQEVRDELLRCKGIGPETADSILLYAGGRPSFVVDAYTRRLFGRLGFLQGGETYDQVRLLFMSHLLHDPDLFNEYHALIVEQCKQVCRVKPGCGHCCLRHDCVACRHGETGC